MPEVAEQEQTEATQPKKVNLDDLDASLVEETVEIDPNANPMEAPPPVSDGKHRFKIVVDNNSWEHKETKANKQGNKTAFLSVKFYLVCVDEGTPDFNKRVFPEYGGINTLVFDGKSVMGYIITCLKGGDAQAKAEVAELNNYVKLAQAFRDITAGEPILQASTQWVAQVNKGTQEDPDYQVVKRGQKTFPPDGKGGYRHIIQTQNGESVARATVQDYFPDK